MRLATYIVWENEGNKYTLKAAPKGDLQLTVKRADGSWQHLGVGKKDVIAFIDGIKNNPENKVLQIHKRFNPKKRPKHWDDPVWVANWKAKNSVHLKKAHEAVRKGKTRWNKTERLGASQ